MEYFVEVIVKTNRRNLFIGIADIGLGLILNSCSNTISSSTIEKQTQPSHEENKQENEITATEDLMHEHGVLRRALFVYSELSARLRNNHQDNAADALNKTAKLFRNFGEEYHEKKLEEAYIFPAIIKSNSEADGYPDILISQHNRGRQLTDYIIDVTQGAKLNSRNVETLVSALESFVRMYRPHAAREDTVVFPEWKQILSPEQLDEMNEKFEEIEHQLFGNEGFENVVRQIAAIETELGLADLAQFTPPPMVKSV